MKTTWCIFDNTALGAAMPNAFQLLKELRCDAAEVKGADHRPRTP